MSKRLHLVVSAVNLVEGGTLTVLRECLKTARRDLSESWDITAIVHRGDLVGVPGIRYIERPEIKASWFSRVWFEYYECCQLSKKLDADFWLAMHDMSPRVVSPRQAVYCHNPMSFYKMSWRETLLDPKLLLFSLFYGFLYQINLLRNDAVIVQQSWIREAFQKRYGCKNVIVAYPTTGGSGAQKAERLKGQRFFYPSFPRVFKNFETLLEAWSLLESDSSWRGELVITIDGSENAYASDLVQRYGHLTLVRFVGRLSHEAVSEVYANTDCLVFPSKLETWGMPLTEAKQHKLAIIAADLPYAHETVGKYYGASFFSPLDAFDLAQKMRAFSMGELEFVEAQQTPVVQPHAQDWSYLFKILLTASKGGVKE